MAKPNSLPCPPFIHIEGVVNSRDLGGYAVHKSNSSSSHIIRPKYIFRSAQLTTITLTGITSLRDANNIKHIYDLRSDQDISNDKAKAKSSTGSLDLQGITRHSVPVSFAESHSPAALTKKFTLYAQDDVPFTIPTPSDTSPQLPPSSYPKTYSQGFVTEYLNLAHLAASTSSFRQIIQHILTHPAEPLIVHCTIGKDRTGVFFALLLSLCGVSYEDIAYDYSLTGDGMGAWREYIVRRVMEESAKDAQMDPTSAEGYSPGDGDVSEKKALTREQAERVVGSRRENMLAFLVLGVDGEMGGARRYWIDRVGLTGEECDRVVDALVVEGVPFLPPRAS